MGNIVTTLDWMRVSGKSVEDIQAGNFFIHVSTILECVEHRKLSAWKVKNTEKHIEKRKSESAGIGSAIHDSIDDYIKNGGDIKKTVEKFNEAPVEVEAFLKNYIAFMKMKDMKAITSENYVYSERYGYAGTFDALVERNGKKYIVDWKTGRSYPIKTGWQLAAYKYAYEEGQCPLTGEEVGTIGVHMPACFPDQAPREFMYRHHEFCFKTFLSTMQVFIGLYFNELKKLNWKYLNNDRLQII